MNNKIKKKKQFMSVRRNYQFNAKTRKLFRNRDGKIGCYKTQASVRKDEIKEESCGERRVLLEKNK